MQIIAQFPFFFFFWLKKVFEKLYGTFLTPYKAGFVNLHWDAFVLLVSILFNGENPPIYTDYTDLSVIYRSN